MMAMLAIHRQMADPQKPAAPPTKLGTMTVPTRKTAPTMGIMSMNCFSLPAKYFLITSAAVQVAISRVMP